MNTLALWLAALAVGLAAGNVVRARRDLRNAHGRLLWSELTRGCWYQDHTPMQLEART